MIRMLALALFCCSAAPALAEADKPNTTHEGTFVKAEDNKLYMKDKDGKDHVHDLVAKPAVTSDGTSCKISDLRAGVSIKVMIGADKHVNKVEATDTREGTFVKAEDNKLYMKGNDGKEYVHDLIAKFKVTSNGAAAKVGDLKPGDKIKATVGIDKRVNKIEATTK